MHRKKGRWGKKKEGGRERGREIEEKEEENREISSQSCFASHSSLDMPIWLSLTSTINTRGEQVRCSMISASLKGEAGICAA
jgi:hypothetical protein